MAQATLESSERFMRGIIDSALDACVSVDRSDRVLDWNSSAEKIFGWSRDEAIGRSLGDLILPERLRAAHRELLAGGMRSEEHTSELQSLMRISYAVFCLKQKKQQTLDQTPQHARPTDGSKQIKT